MGYYDKQRKKAEIRKMVKQIMNSHEYKEAVKKDQQQAAMRAYCNFVLMSCDYLEQKHNYGKKGLEHFLEFAMKRLNYITEDNEKYYQEMNQYFIDTYKIDVLGCLGVQIIDGGEVDGQPKINGATC